MIGTKRVSLKKKIGFMAMVLAFALTIVQIGFAAEDKKQDADKQKEVNAYGADIDQTIIRQYKYLEDYAKGLVDEDIQSVPYQVTIIQPLREWEKKGKDGKEKNLRNKGTDKVMTEDGRVRFKDNNTIEIIQHGFIYKDDFVVGDPIGRKFKTLKIVFTGEKDNRKIKEIQIELYEKNYQRKTFYIVRILDKQPITTEKKEYAPDANGITALDQNITIQRRSNRDDAEQLAKEAALANQSSDQGVPPFVEKGLVKIKNTPAQPLRNTFKNNFYRVHLAHFSNIVFHIYEMHNTRSKNSDNYMLDFLRESTTY